MRILYPRDTGEHLIFCVPGVKYFGVKIFVTFIVSANPSDRYKYSGFVFASLCRSPVPVLLSVHGASDLLQTNYFLLTGSGRRNRNKWLCKNQQSQNSRLLKTSYFSRSKK